MREELQALKEQALKELETAASVDALKDLRVKYLGKKGHMTDILRGMGSLPAEERPKIGQIVNEVKKVLEEAIAAKAEVLEAEALKQRLASEKVDITLPGRKPQCGHLHPITLTMREIKKIFMRMGFEVLEGPQIESDYYNFEALNLPKDHPARDMQDTFYITEDIAAHADFAYAGAQNAGKRAGFPNPHDFSGHRIPQRLRRNPFTYVPSGGRFGAGKGYQPCRFKRHTGNLLQGNVRQQRKHPPAPELFPVYRTERGS